MKKDFGIGIFISSRGSNMKAIHERFPQNIAFIGSDNPGAKGLMYGSENNVPIFVTDYEGIKKEIGDTLEMTGLPEDYSLEGFPPDFTYEDLVNCLKVEKSIHKIRARALAEYDLLKKIEKYGPIDFLVLAGFMRVVSAYFIRLFNPDPFKPGIMNIHPTYLPAFPGTHGYRKARIYGCKLAAITVHFVDASLDGGPIIAQEPLRILEDDTDESLEARGLPIEWKILPRCIDLFSEGCLKVYEEGGRKRVKVT